MWNEMDRLKLLAGSCIDSEILLITNNCTLSVDTPMKHVTHIHIPEHDVERNGTSAGRPQDIRSHRSARQPYVISVAHNIS
jgi:hypothetical protein